MRNKRFNALTVPSADAFAVGISALSLLLVGFWSTGFAFAQDSAGQSNPPDVVVIKKSWHSEGRNRALDEDPLRNLEQMGQVQQAQQDAMRENVLRANANLPPVPIPQSAPPDIRRGAMPDPLPRQVHSAPAYVYQVKLRNTGPKTIRGIVWEYLLFDPGTKRELGRHVFTSNKQIRPGKIETLVGRTPNRPAPIIRVVKAGDAASRPHYDEQVVIKRIAYDDGSVWRATSN